jgi:hypothetical protein
MAEIAENRPKKHLPKELEKYKWKPGKSANPAGKPKGTISPIQRVKQIFLQNPKMFESFIEDYIKDPNNRKHIVEMIDGKPKQAIVGGGEDDQPVKLEWQK